MILKWYYEQKLKSLFDNFTGEDTRLRLQPIKWKKRDERMSIISIEVRKGCMTTNVEMVRMVENLRPSAFSFVRD
jgi:hypothetical protein